MSTDSLQQIIGLVEQLDQRELAVVLQTVAARIARPSGARRSVLELQGLGKDEWSGVDVDQYLERERDSWEWLAGEVRAERPGSCRDSVE